MTFEQFQKLFPNQSVVLRYVERGPAHARKFMWCGRLGGGYFTSDSDRMVASDDEYREFEFGDTIELVFSAIVVAKARELKELVRRRADCLTESQEELAKFARALEEVGL